MHSSIKRALRNKQLQQDDHPKTAANQTSQRYLPRLELSKLGQTEPICPHCEAELDAVPSQTSNCPHCAQEIIVMSRPKDKATVLVNADEAAQLNKEWEAYNERRDPYLRKKGAHAINLEYSELWDQLAREPTIKEIKESFMKKDKESK